MEGTNEGPLTDPLTAAVVEAARHAAGGKWGEPPRLYALAPRKSLSGNLSAQVRAAAPDALIPIEQRPLDPGDPAEVLAGIYWPESVDGCVLVTEIVIDGDGSPAKRQARLTVGVLRDGPTAARYSCCLQRRDSDEFVISPDIADDLVAALLGTL